MTTVRRRITHHTGRAQIALQLRRSARPVAIYLVGLAIGVACILYIAGNLPGGGGLSSSQTYEFAVNDGTGVVPGRDEVRFKGIPAGEITGAALVHGQAVLTISLYSRFGRLYRDARAQLRPNTPLEDMYLDIVSRGTPGSGPASASDPLPPSQTSTSVNISDVLNVFNENVRTNLATTLSQFGQGLGNRGAQIRTAFIDLVPFIEVAGRISQQIAARSTETRQLIHNIGELTAELGRRQQALTTLVKQGGQTLDTLAAGAPGLSATLSALPPTLSELNSSFASVRAVLPSVDSAIRSLEPVAKELPAALPAVRALSDSAHPALTSLLPAVGRLEPLAVALRPLSDSTSTAIHALLPQTGAVDQITQNVAACGFTIQRFFQWTQSVFSMGDAHGEAPRGDAAIGLDTPGLVPDPNVTISPTCSNAKIEGGAPTPLQQP